MTGVAGTVAIHLLLLLFLFLCYITPNLSRSSEELSGVPVMFGNVEDAGGDDEPSGRAETAAPNVEDVATPNQTAQQEQTKVTPLQATSTEKAPALKDNQNVHTQDMEDAPAVAAKKSAADKAHQEAVAAVAAKKSAAEKAHQEAVAAEKLRKEQARIAQEQASRSAAIKNNVSGAFGNGTGSSSRGQGKGAGTQGVPTGNSNHGKTSGVGGTGTYDLGGRGVGGGGLVLPSYTVDDYGRVVIDIIVDPNGNVVDATIGRGTNTPSASLRSEALRAAKRTKFQSASIAGNQKGTITYKFNLR